jgi:glycosyltransferase involved in cell wall biosynthesis
MKKKILRITTVSESLNVLLKGQLRFLNQFYNVVGVASDVGSLNTVNEREGIRTINLHMDRVVSLKNDFKSLVRMIRLIRKEKPFIVHSNTPKASLLSMISAKLCQTPIRIYTVTGLRFEGEYGIKRDILKLMEKISCKCATNVIPEGDGVRDTLIREKITNKPLKKILNGNINGIDTSYFDPKKFSVVEKRNLRNSLNISENDFVYIFIGRLVKDKGINELISAFFDLDDLNCKLLLVGPFELDLDPLLPETMTEIENNPNIISVGYQDDVRSFLSISNCLVFPSYREGFPNVVMQAGAMGLPSIVTNINGCNEIIIEGENGVIIPPKDKDMLLNAMRYFFNNLSDVKRMASNARPLIVTRYEQKAVWEALLVEYKRLEEEIL